MYTILFFLLLATLSVLVLGIVFMAIGGKLDKRYANKLMMARVILQTLAIITLAILYLSKNWR